MLSAFREGCQAVLLKPAFAVEPSSNMFTLAKQMKPYHSCLLQAHAPSPSFSMAQTPSSHLPTKGVQSIYNGGMRLSIPHGCLEMLDIP